MRGEKGCTLFEWREARGGQARAGRAEVERKPPAYSVLRLLRVVVRLWHGLLGTVDEGSFLLQLTGSTC